MEGKQKIIGLLVVFALIVALSFTIMLAKPKSATGAAASMSSEGFDSYEEMMAAHHPEQTNQMSSEGFSSYEEMMAAHHGGATSGSDSAGCGGVAEGVGKNIYEGQTSDYGITYDNAGYQQLLSDAKNIALDAEKTKLIVGLNIEIPCCGVKTLQASGNCECGHHVAMHGLAKLMASKGYAREQIQSELNKWKIVFYPEGSSGTGGC